MCSDGDGEDRKSATPDRSHRVPDPTDIAAPLLASLIRDKLGACLQHSHIASERVCSKQPERVHLSAMAEG